MDFGTSLAKPMSQIRFLIGESKMTENGNTVDRSLDLRGWSCPWCILKAKSWLRQMARGQVLEILSTDSQMQDDFPSILEKTGDCLLCIEQRKRHFRLLVRRG